MRTVTSWTHYLPNMPITGDWPPPNYERDKMRKTLIEMGFNQDGDSIFNDRLGTTYTSFVRTNPISNKAEEVVLVESNGLPSHLYRDSTEITLESLKKENE